MESAPEIDRKTLKEGQQVILCWPSQWPRGEDRYSDWVTLYRPSPGYPWLFAQVDGHEEHVIQTFDWWYGYVPPVVVVARREA